MPTRITSPELRRLMCKLAIESLRAGASCYLQEETFGTHAGEVLLCWAVLIGQIEKKPMPASKLAHYVGMPRATVVRKLKELEARGVIEIADGIPALQSRVVNSFPPIALQQSVRSTIERMASELSKMDTDPIAAQKRPAYGPAAKLKK